MKRAICLSVLALMLASASYAQRMRRGTEIYASDYAAGGARTSLVLSNILVKVGSSDVSLVIDAGPWSITDSSLTFPSNISMRVPIGSGFQIYSNYVVTFSNCWLDAGFYPIFWGAGTATGQVQCTYRIPEWGNTNQFNIGVGDLPGTDTNAVLAAVTNAWPYLDTDSRDDITTNNIAEEMTNAYPYLDTDYRDDAQELGYINGAYVGYSDPTTITVSVGDGWNTTNYFNVTNTITHVMTTLAVGGDFHYIYIDSTNTTFPDGVSVFDSTSEGSYNSTYHAYYSGANRRVGAVHSTNGVAVLTPFHMSEGRHIYDKAKPIDDGKNPNGNWQDPTWESSLRVPADAINILACVSSFGAGGAPCRAYATRSEIGDLIAAGLVDQGYAPAQGAIIGGNGGGSFYCTAVGWLSLGPSRDIDIAAEDDDSLLRCWVLGWEIAR